MSVSYYAFLVYGVEINKEWLYKINKERGCSHALHDDANFCPVCGAKMWIEDRELDIEFCNDSGLSYFAPSYDSSDVVLGFSLGVASEYRGSIQSNLEEPTQAQIDELMNLCKELDILLEVTELKKHLVMYCSY